MRIILYFWMLIAVSIYAAEPRYFAEIDGEGVIIRVVVAAPEWTLKQGGQWIETKMDARGDSAKGYNYAGIGYKYDSTRRGFIPPAPYASWVLDERTLRYKAPKPQSSDPAIAKDQEWDESKQDWVVVSRKPEEKAFFEF